MDKISIIPFRGTDIHILYKKGQLGYSFKHGEETYGQKVTLQSKSINDIVSAAFLLFVSCIESIESLNAKKVEQQVAELLKDESK